MHLKALDDEIKARALERVSAPAGRHDTPVPFGHVWRQGRPVAHQDLVEDLRNKVFQMTTPPRGLSVMLHVY